MQNLALTGDGKAAQDYQVVLVTIVAFAAADRADPMKALIGRVGEQGIERREPPFTAAPGALAIDLLQAQHVGTEAQQLRPEKPNPFFQRRAGDDRLTEVLDIEGGDPQQAERLTIRHACTPASAGGQAAAQEIERRRRVPLGDTDNASGFASLESYSTVVGRPSIPTARATRLSLSMATGRWRMLFLS